MTTKYTNIFIIVLTLLLTSCGGGSDTSPSGNSSSGGATSSSGGTSMGVAITHFEAMPSLALPGEAVSLIWSISNTNNVSLSCYLDIDNDGNFETQVNNCSDGQIVTLSGLGNQDFGLRVEDSIGRAVLATTTVSVGGTVLTVNSNIDSPDALAGDGNCQSMTNSCTLRAAVMEANQLSAQGQAVFINLPANTYQLTEYSSNEDASLDGDLDISGQIVLRGSGANTTIIDASQANDRVFHVADNARFEVFGVSIQGGRAIQGAGLLIADAQVLFSDVKIDSNTATFGGGGGIYSSGQITATGLEVSNNVADDWGAGIYLASSNAISLNLDNCKVNSNRVNMSGGGLYATTGTVSIDSCEFLNNIAGVQGGAIYNSSADITISYTTIDSNNSTGPGGGILNSAGPLKLDSSTISNNNTVNNSGGGLYNRAGGPTYAVEIINSTISGNQAAYDGGGVWNRGSMGVAFTTITNNTAGQNGGGIFVETIPSTETDIKAAILSNNFSASNGPQCSGSLNSLGYNIFESTLGCAVTSNTGDIAGTSPYLNPLDDNGGPTKTHSFEYTSNAKDHIPINDCTDLNNVMMVDDQRGIARPDSLMCDVGSIEL